jgi:hypothetical protein
MSRGWFAIILLAFVAPASAATLAINGDAPKQNITVVAESATVDGVLQELAARYGFEIKGLEHLGTGEALSAKMSGSLYDVLSRLLRNRNYMIVRSPDKATGVARVMILDASYGAARTKAAQIQSGEGAEELLQALSGSSD